MLSGIRVAGMLGTVVESNFKKLSRPYKLNFSVTYMCQSRCVHCSIWQIKPKNELTIDEIREFASQNNYFKWVELTGGEPFLRSDIVEIAKTFTENCGGLYLMTMPTNSLCSYEMEIRKIEEILKLGMPHFVITVSLDGYRELHDKIRGVPGNYDRAIRLFKGLQELSKRYKNLVCTFGFTIINQNVGQLEKTINEVMKEVSDFRYSYFHVNLGQLSANYYGNTSNTITANSELALKDIEFMLGKMKTVKESGFARWAKSYLEIKYLEGLAEFIKTGKSPVPNRDGELSIFLDSYGTIYPTIMSTKKLWSTREGGYDLRKMYKEYDSGGVKENYYTPCESYQSVLGAILKR